jgi:hypothetical protein
VIAEHSQNYSWDDIFMKQLPDLLQFQLSRSNKFVSSCVHESFSYQLLMVSWETRRKDKKKVDDYIHGIVNVFLCHHQGVLQRRYGQNSLNISIILYTNPTNHSWNMKWWHKQIVMVNYIVAMMIVAWFSIKCLHRM